jgi:hypothetical protein
MRSSRNTTNARRRTRRASTTSRNRGTYKQPLVVTDENRDVVRSPNEGLTFGLIRPLQFITTPAHFRKIRFFVKSVAINSLAVTFQDLLKLMVFSTAVNTGYSRLDCIRLRYVEFWEPFQGTAGITSTAGLVWEGSGGTNTGINRSIFATSSAPDQPAHVFSKPPSDTLIGAWMQKTSTSTAFTLNNLDVGTVFDIAFDYILGDNDTTVGIGPIVLVAAAAGISGIHPFSTSLVALGVNNM